MAMQTFGRLSGIIQSEIGCDASLQPTTLACEVPGWDSGAMVNILFAVEDAFGVTLTSSEMESIRGVGDLLALVEQRCDVAATAF